MVEDRSHAADLAAVVPEAGDVEPVDRLRAHGLEQAEAKAETRAIDATAKTKRMLSVALPEKAASPVAVNVKQYATGLN